MLSFRDVLKKKISSLFELERRTLYVKTTSEVDDPSLVFSTTLQNAPLYYKFFCLQLQRIILIRRTKKDLFRQIYKFLISK